MDLTIVNLRPFISLPFLQSLAAKKQNIHTIHKFKYGNILPLYHARIRDPKKVLVLRTPNMEVQRNCPIEKTGKCTKLLALIVVRNVKFHSSQTQADRFTAEIVGRREDRQEEVDISQEAP